MRFTDIKNRNASSTGAVLASRRGGRCLGLALAWLATCAPLGGAALFAAQPSAPSIGRPESLPAPAADIRPPAPPLASERDPKSVSDPMQVESSAGPEPIAPIVPESETYTIDLPTALRLAESANPQLGASREAIREALAVWRGARVLLLPNLNAGTNYHQHNGVLQTSFGLMRNITEQSLYVGGGARTLAAETVGVPAVQIFQHLGDAIYLPIAARQEVGRARATATATENDTMLLVANAYLRLAGAELKLEAWNVSRVQLHEIVKATQVFALAGQGRDGDYKRARTEALFMRSQQQGAQAEVYFASTELARLLRLDPSVRLTTGKSSMELLELVDPTATTEQLTSIALGRRPEINARVASIEAANTRYKQERNRVFYPTMYVGFSAGGFGGGSNLTALGVDSFYQRFSSRDDFDVSAIWTLQNFGAGNVAMTRQRRSERDALIGSQTVLTAEVRRQVAQSYAGLEAQRRLLKVTAIQLAAAERGAQEEITRTRSGEGLPIESLNSMTLVADARQNVVDAIMGHNIAQFQLLVAIGQTPRMQSPAMEQGNEIVEEVPVPLPDVLQGAAPRNPLEDPTK